MIVTRKSEVEYVGELGMLGVFALPYEHNTQLCGSGIEYPFRNSPIIIMGGLLMRSTLYTYSSCHLLNVI